MNATTDDAAHVVIGDAPLRRDTLVRLARAPSGQLTIGETARARVRAGEQRLAAALARGERVYGVNTGCGALDDQRVDAERSARLQRNLLRSHAAGVGEPMARDAVRAMILARLSTLCRGDSAVRLELVEALGALLQHDVTPWVPTVGSLGVSDLTALAHVGLTLVGEGRARVGDGPFIDAARALEQVGLPP
ncbi:MAG: aromatic amino acid lyase, partial [Myxococcales bacterium]|nr:aromatic amino acid lyase [Myxococcales bacterium]